MFRSKGKTTLGILACIAVLLAATLPIWRRPAAAARAQQPFLPKDDALGYGAAFNRELAKIGQISPEDFAKRYPAPTNYAGKFSWDPTTAKFWDEFNRDPNDQANQLVPNKRPGKRQGWGDFRVNEAELAKLKDNGFVVSERLGGASFAEVFYRIYARDLPVFISSDAILHAWHRSYDGMLEQLEESYLADSLQQILSGMHENVPLAEQEYGKGVLADSLKDADYFLAVGLSLLNDQQVPTKLNQDRRVAGTLARVKNMQIEEMNLFGRRREVDFSQFKVRGHYENSEQLKRYFRAMMWCGRTDLRIAGGEDYFGELSSARELGSAIILNDLLGRAGPRGKKGDVEGLFARWERFDRLIQTFVGRTDSATFAHLDALMKGAGIVSPADLKTAEDIEALQAKILAGKIGLQEIRGDVYTSPLGGDKQVILPRSFTVLGQKFVLDSWVTSKIVYDDILWDGEKVGRFVPSCVDVAFAALGNNQTTPILVGRMNNGPNERRDKLNYQHHLAAARNTIDLHPAAAWKENLYMSWLGTLRELSTPTTGAKYPEAMRSKAWGMKTLTTQMASWTQLRHDTILYAKQSYSVKVSCFYPAGYVEPVPHFWSRFEKMTARAGELMAQTPYPPQLEQVQARQVGFLKNFTARVKTLREISEKQFAQKELTKDETKFIEEIVQIDFGCGGPPDFSGWYPGLFYKDPADCGKWDALVADVHTDPNDETGSVLHQGVGNIDLLMIAIDSGKDRMMFAGPVFSHYEFEMKGAVRKSDAEWRQDINTGKLPPRPEWTRTYLAPGINPFAKDYRAD